MPELPEVQALAERLEAAVGGAELAALVPLQFSALKTFAPPPEGLIGLTLRDVARRGKFLVLSFGPAEPRLLIHLSQGGRIDIESPPKATKPKGAVLRMAFRGPQRPPSILVKEFGTERKAGWWVVSPGDEGPLAKLGPEPASPEFAELIMHGDDRRRVHTLLRDQRTVAGIGRGYADDALHRARLSPFASLAGLSEAQRADLLAAILGVLDEALVGERTRMGGLPPKLGDRFVVHNRWGTPCPRCGDDLRRVSYESHTVTYCPTCQTGGQILADRRMSRLLGKPASRNARGRAGVSAAMSDATPDPSLDLVSEDDD
jgi:formamidopyrimidine-DNA glycosylase